MPVCQSGSTGSNYLVTSASATSVAGKRAQPTTLCANLIGTPDELWEQHLRRKQMVGVYEIVANFSFGGMPCELVYDQMKRFANRIPPKLKS